MMAAAQPSEGSAAAAGVQPGVTLLLHPFHQNTSSFGGKEGPEGLFSVYPCS